MPIINVDMFPGRTKEQKRALVRELTNAIVTTCAADPTHVHVIIRERATDDWGYMGQLATDLLEQMPKP